MCNSEKMQTAHGRENKMAYVDAMEKKKDSEIQKLVSVKDQLRKMEER